MNKLKQLTIICLFVFVSLFFVSNIKAYELIGTNPYEITNYDINIIVNENNTFLITETIDAYFNEQRHGIIRSIPMRNNIYRLDGSTSVNNVKISNINVNNEFTTYDYDLMKNIRIGNANLLITGEQKYVISYLYDIGKDPSKNYDEFYFNLVGKDWDTTVSNITFKIIMPKDFDESKIGFSSGLFGSVDSSLVDYSVNGNVITGSYKAYIVPNSSLTIRLELPEDYFVVKIELPDMMSLISMGVSILLALIAYAMWYKYGRDERVIETVEFYPPNGFNSAEVGFLYNGEVSTKDVVSLLVYLANKNYIKITETKEKPSLFSSKDYKISKLKEYDGTNENERIFLDGLFKSKEDENIVLTEVTSSDLYDHFYITLNKIKKDMNSKKNKQTIFEKGTFGKRALLVLMICVVFLTIYMQVIVTSEVQIESVGLMFMFPILGIYALLDKFNRETPLFGKVTVVIFTAFYGFGPILLVALSMPGSYYGLYHIVTYLIGIISIVVMAIIYGAMPKRTKYGTDMLGKLRGFKNFLKAAEKDKLEQLVMREPTYFYNILPYTYVLGVSDKWIKKFEFISIDTPEWYESEVSFDITSFGAFIDSTMDSAKSVVISSSSGGGFDGGSSSGSSGGGSSGGGSGGGGGSSW